MRGYENPIGSRCFIALSVECAAHSVLAGMQGVCMCRSSHAHLPHHLTENGCIARGGPTNHHDAR